MRQEVSYKLAREKLLGDLVPAEEEKQSFSNFICMPGKIITFLTFFIPCWLKFEWSLWFRRNEAGSVLWNVLLYLHGRSIKETRWRTNKQTRKCGKKIYKVDFAQQASEDGKRWKQAHWRGKSSSETVCSLAWSNKWPGAHVSAESRLYQLIAKRSRILHSPTFDFFVERRGECCRWTSLVWFHSDGIFCRFLFRPPRPFLPLK